MFRSWLLPISSKTGKKFGRNHPPPSTNQKIVCIVAGPYVPCNLALAPLVVNCSVQFFFLVRDTHCCGLVLTITLPTNITSGCNMNTITMLVLGSHEVAAVWNSKVTANQRQELYSPDVV